MTEYKKKTDGLELSKENLDKGIDKISKAFNLFNEGLKSLDAPENVMEKEITEFGNSSHIILPKEYAKKKAIVIIKK